MTSPLNIYHVFSIALRHEKKAFKVLISNFNNLYSLSDNILFSSKVIRLQDNKINEHIENANFIISTVIKKYNAEIELSLNSKINFKDTKESLCYFKRIFKSIDWGSPTTQLEMLIIIRYLAVNKFVNKMRK